MRLRRAFTLVELLVILAILAVIAGMLFPVFASAVSASKASTCISNFRQIGSTTAMYQVDYDDHFMPVNHQPAETPNSRNDRTWVQLVLPYVRSFAIFRCPSDHSIRPRAESLFDQDLVPGDAYSQFYTASMRTNFGFNFQYLSPILWGPTGWYSSPRGGSWLKDPSSTIQFVDSVWSLENGSPVGGGSWLVVPPCRYEVNTQGTRDTFTGQQGLASVVFTTSVGWEASPKSPFQFGGAWPWHRGRMTIARADGSVKQMTPDELSAGCDVRPNWTGRISNSQHYLWDTN